MKFATSYFYQIRHFKPYMIPLSTAIWDPKWFHNDYGANHVFIDKNGVINGLRINPLAPGQSCSGLCRGADACSIKNPQRCDFIQQYKKQLKQIDFTKFMEQLDASIAKICTMTSYVYNEPLVVFIFHEKYDNLCSERGAVQDWFCTHGVECSELLYPIKDYYED